MENKKANFFKEQGERKIKAFFGETKKASTKYFRFNQLIDEDTCIVLTSNVSISRNKNQIRLITGPNQVIFLKEYFDIRSVVVNEFGETYAVKIKRNMFNKIYTYKQEFENSPEKEMTFEDWYEIAKLQENEKQCIRTVKGTDAGIDIWYSINAKFY